MFINENNLKELPQVDVIPPSLELDSATSARGDNFFMKKEVWYPLPNYEGYFEISNLLRIRYTVIHNIKNGYTWNHVTGLPHKRKRKLSL